MCYEKAGEMCGEAGYDVLYKTEPEPAGVDINVDVDVVVSQGDIRDANKDPYGSGQPVPEGVTREMQIACRQ